MPRFVRRSPCRVGFLAFMAFLPALILGLGVPFGPAFGFPPFAEEWSIPGSPQDVEVDPFGRVWVSSDDDSIRVFAPTGGEQLFAFGGRGTDDGQFLTPYGIAFDAAGDVYICDYEGARLQKFTSAGDFSLSWPIPSSRADHVAADDDGDIYVSGYTDAAVHKYTSSGVPLLDWGSAGGDFTSGVVVQGGTVSVVQWSTPIVEQFSTAGAYLGSFDAGTVNGVDIEADALGQLWVADFGGNAVLVFASDGTAIETFGSFGTSPGEFDGAVGLALGTDGSVYVADYGNGRIQRFGDPVADAGWPATAISPLAITSIAPNPTRDRVELAVAVARQEPVRLTINDVHGRVVATVFDGVMPAGSRNLSWQARGAHGARLPDGVYFVRLATPHGVVASRLVLVR